MTVAQPRLSNMAVQLRREEDVAERLYNYKQKYEEKQKMKSETVPDEVGGGEVVYVQAEDKRDEQGAAQERESA